MTPYAKPRFITDPEIIRKILDRCKIIHLGMQEDGHVYVVPTNYGYTYEDGKLTFYSHGAMEGKKWDIIKKNPEICVEIDTGFEPCRQRRSVRLRQFLWQHYRHRNGHYCRRSGRKEENS